MKRIAVNSFIGGAIKPRLFGRTDSELYQHSLREAVNVIVNPDGGLTKRPGSQVIRDLLSDDVRLEAFTDEDGNNSILELGYDTAGYMKMHTQTTFGSKITTGVLWSSAAELKAMHCENEDGKQYISHESNSFGYIKEGTTDIEIGTDTYYPIVTDSKVTKVSATVIKTNNTGGDFQFFATDIGQYLTMIIGTAYYYALITAVAETEYDETADTGFYYSQATIGAVTSEAGETAWASVVNTTAITHLGLAPFNQFAATFKPGTVCFAGGRMYLSRFDDDKRRIYGSKIGEYTNFRLGPADNFGLDFTLTEMYGGEIEWLQGGKELIVGTDTGTFTVTAEGGLGATSIPVIIKQSAIGVSPIKPVMVGDIYVYPQKSLDGLRIFQYQVQKDQYTTPELTKMASHLFDSEIVDIASIEQPFSMYFMVLADGNGVILTYDLASSVVSCCEQAFTGTLQSVAVLRGDKNDNIYMAITNGTTTTLQKLEDILFDGDLEDGVFVETATVETGASGSIAFISAADPGTITLSDATDFSNADFVEFSSMDSGETALDTLLELTTYKIANKSTNTFDLQDVDGTDVDLSGYTGGSATGTIKIVKKVVTALDRYNGTVVEAISDGVSGGDFTVASNQITLADYANKIVVGYAYSAYIKLLPLGIYPEGWKRVLNVGVNVYKTTGLKIGEALTSWTELTFDDEIILDTADELFSGVKRMPFNGSSSNDNDVYIGTDTAVPMNLLCLYLQVEMEAGNGE